MDELSICHAEEGQAQVSPSKYRQSVVVWPPGVSN